MKTHHLRITLAHSDPKIWREVRMPSASTLEDVHSVIQVLFGWNGSHLHQFSLKGGRKASTMETPFGDSITTLEDELDEAAISLSEACPTRGSRMSYEYDLGDSWIHLIETLKIEEADTDMLCLECLGGELASPPDDCGGMYGYYRLIDALADPECEDHEQALDWLPADFDPTAFDRKATQAALVASWGL